MTTSDSASDAARIAAEEAAQAAEAAEKAAQEARKRAGELAAAAEQAEAETARGPANGTESEPEPESESESEIVQLVKAGYSFAGAALQIGALVDGEAVPEAQVRIPLAMLNRHGLVAGATGTGKTKTLQVLAEQVAALGVPVFAADIKGDLSGIATAGTPSDKLLARTQSIGQDWQPAATPTEYFTLGGLGTGVPIRASIDSFGPLLLAKVLGLNETQESSLALVFHYAREAKLPLIDLGDLRSVLTWLTGDGKAELKELGGLSSATAGVILRELIAFSDAGADVFFGQPEIRPSDFLRTTSDGKGIVSLLEVPSVQDKPALFSTFLMYLLSQLFKQLPEVGDTDKPKLVFFFDEAHLLFKDASKDFLESVAQTVRLIRSKGVGVFFVTQTPKDVPSDVLAQLGSRVQHQLRAHTPDAAKALRATVSTYPNSSYDLEEVLTQLAIGEAIVTVMNEKGAPSPVAWTRVRAPQGSMEPTPAAQIAKAVNESPLLAQYGTAVNPASATETIDAKEAAVAKAAQEAAAEKQSWDQEIKRSTRRTRTSSGSTSRYRRQSPLEKAAGEAARTAARELIKNIFKRR
ncbi:MAG TPA: helicase HerA-like domain-containing protein [Aeromicrobium sp.]|nr:helicase HerA-like domain-containing protein [Aeromicrobium sp.]HKY58282.1 helicase HerA-like domain-containing protein [Aeromicrobium sp.]